MTSISTYRQSMSQIQQFKTMQATMEDLQRQLTTNKKTTLFKGLGGDVILSERSRATINSLTTYRTNITNADRRIELMTTAIESLNEHGNDLSDTLRLQVQEGEMNMDEIATLTDYMYDSMVGLLQEKDGERYLFGGASTQEKPIEDRGTLDTYVNARVTEWINGTITNDELIASYRDTTQLNDSTVGYSTTLSADNAQHVFARVDDNRELDYTVLADDEAFRDILVATNMLKGLSENLDKITLEEGDDASLVTSPGFDESAQSHNFYEVFNDISQMLSDAMDKLDGHYQDLTQVRVQMNNFDQSHEAEITTLQSVIEDVENVDINEVAVAISTLQFQMEAAYSVAASMSEISLVNYL